MVPDSDGHDQGATKVRHAFAFTGIIMITLLGCANARSANIERCEFGEFPSPHPGGSGEAATSWGPKQVTTVTSNRDEYHRRNVVVTGYYRWAYEESALWSSREGYAHHALTDDISMVVISPGRAERHLRYCADLDIIIYGEFAARHVLGENAILPYAIRVVR